MPANTWTDRAQTAVRRAMRAPTSVQYRARLADLLFRLGTREWWHRHPKRMAARVAKHGSPVWRYTR